MSTWDNSVRKNAQIRTHSCVHSLHCINSLAEKRHWYLFVVWKRLALSRQRVGPVLSHGPLLRWHGFHQGSVDPRGRAHRRYIPMIRALSPKFIRWRAGHGSEENPWWRAVYPEEDDARPVRCALLCVSLSELCLLCALLLRSSSTASNVVKLKNATSALSFQNKTGNVVVGGLW